MSAPASTTMRVLRSMNHKLADGLLYVRHRGQPVRDDDWQAMMNDIAKQLHTGSALKILVKTDNAGPNVVQRGKLNDLVTKKGGTLRIAVLSSSMLVRGIVTAFSWMRVVQIRSFGPFDFAAGIAFLDVAISVDDAERAMAEIERAVA